MTDDDFPPPRYFYSHEFGTVLLYGDWTDEQAKRATALALDREWWEENREWADEDDFTPTDLERLRVSPDRLWRYTPSPPGDTEYRYYLWPVDRPGRGVFRARKVEEVFVR